MKKIKVGFGESCSEGKDTEEIWGHSVCFIAITDQEQPIRALDPSSRWVDKFEG